MQAPDKLLCLEWMKNRGAVFSKAIDIKPGQYGSANTNGSSKHCLFTLLTRREQDKTVSVNK